MLASIIEQHDFCYAAGDNGHAHENGLIIIIARLEQSIVFPIRRPFSPKLKAYKLTHRN